MHTVGGCAAASVEAGTRCAPAGTVGERATRVRGRCTPGARIRAPLRRCSGGFVAKRRARVSRCRLVPSVMTNYTSEWQEP